MQHHKRAAPVRRQINCLKKSGLTRARAPFLREKKKKKKKKNRRKKAAGYNLGEKPTITSTGTAGGQKLCKLVKKRA